jgi:hypothetical protein
MSLPLWSLVTVAKRSTSKSSTSVQSQSGSSIKRASLWFARFFCLRLFGRSMRKGAKAQSRKVGDLAKNFLLS